MINPILKGVADNAEMTKALKELLLKQFDDEGNTNLTDEALGQVTRARLTGISKINNAFKELETLKTVKEKPVVDNPAR